MLSKLLKYEFKATARIFLPMYALLVVFALLNKLFMSINSEFFDIPKVIAMSVFVIIIVGICVMTLVVTIQRFNKNLLTDEGYLSFTLPVKAHTHIDCKIIVTMVWYILSALAAALAILVLAINQDTIADFQRFFIELGNGLREAGPQSIVLIVEMILTALLSVYASTIQIYASITVGNLSSKHKMLAGIGAYLGFGMIEQIIASIFMSFNGDNLRKLFDHLNTTPRIVYGVEIAMLIMIIYFVVFSVAYYILTNWLLKNKLNLE
jgi:hypothetical protein